MPPFIATLDPQRMPRRDYLRYTERRAPALHRAYCDIAGLETPWEIPTRLGDRVLCYEAEPETYRMSATSLGIPAEVQTFALDEYRLGGQRVFFPQSLATGVVSGVARCELGMDPENTINFDTRWPRAKRWATAGR
ncbi:MAG: hypothetical protein HC945_01880 [Nitrosarchaeum sp.]|nr:hypothetical protein [Nitrosarchaeum sp.]